jgi:hypothetical protein
MTTRADYAPQEWETLQFAVLWVQDAIGEADGVLSQIENETLNKDLFAHTEGLIGEVFASIVPEGPNIMARYKADPRPIQQGLTDVADLLDARTAPDEAQAFKETLLQISADIATADGEVQEIEGTVHNMLALNLRYTPQPPGG